MTSAEPTEPAGRTPFRPLVLSRTAEQAALGLGSLLLARALGPAAFAPVAVLFVVNSLAVQISDLGLGFAVLRTPPGAQLARASLSSVRRAAIGAAMAGALLAVVVAVVVGATAAWVVFGGALVWPLTAEAYVRKASALKLGATLQVVEAEVAGATAFGVGVALVIWARPGLGWIVAVFVAKSVVELVTVRTWRDMFSPEGLRARSGPEWLGQVMTYLVANADYVVVASTLGPSDLARYVVSFRVASALPSLVAHPVTQSAFVELAAAEDRDPIHRSIVRRALLAGGAGAVLVLAAAPVLPWVLGGEWEGTGAVMAVLAPAVPIRMLLGTTVALAITVGAARQVVVWEAGRLVAVAAATAAGAVLGGLVPAAGAASAATIVSVGAEHVLAARSASIPPDHRVLVLVPLLASVAAVGALVLG